MSSPLSPSMSQDRARWVALYILCTGMLMIVLDVTVVNVALPSIQSSLHFPSSGLAWVVNAYLIAFGGLLLLAGRLGDLLGRRRIFMAGLVLFTAASAVCGLSVSQAMLVAARFVQGIGGAFVTAVILGMIVTMFPEDREQSRAIGIFAFVASAGGAIGLLAGGVLTQLLNWHWIFFVNLPIGLVTGLLARKYVPEDNDREDEGGVDVIGALLITSAVMLGVFTIVQPGAQKGWGAGETLACSAATLVLLAGFVVRQARAAQPLIPLRILKSPTVRAANVVQVLAAAGLYGMFFLGALYAQKVLHYDALSIGVAFLPMTVLMGAISVRYSERLVDRFGEPPLCVLGMGMIAAALGFLAWDPSGAGYWLNLFPALVVMGFGAGFCFPPMIGLAMSGSTDDDAGLASGLVNAMGQVGGAIGLAVIATSASTRTANLTAHGSATIPALVSGYHLGFLLGAILTVVGTGVALLLRAEVEIAETEEILAEAEEGFIDYPDPSPQSVF